MRIGHGYDIHAFTPDKPLVLGGVTIPDSPGLKGHSDADAVLHAVCDALLGAAALGDIGEHFSDKDPRWAGMDSRHFLRAVKEMLDREGYKVGNIDVSIIAEKPKLSAYKSQMRANIAEDCQIDERQVNIKATTNEKMGHLGRAEGIAVHCVAIIL